MPRINEEVILNHKRGSRSVTQVLEELVKLADESRASNMHIGSTNVDVRMRVDHVSTICGPLIEILVVLGMLALLSTVVLVAVNPLRQFAQARNTQREANVSALLNAVGHRLADNQGIFTTASSSCEASLPSSAKKIQSEDGYDLRPCLVPNYLPELPYDPAEGMNTCTSENCDGNDEEYKTEYTIMQSATTSRITICAPHHAEAPIDGSAEFCLTR